MTGIKPRKKRSHNPDAAPARVDAPPTGKELFLKKKRRREKIQKFLSTSAVALLFGLVSGAAAGFITGKVSYGVLGGLGAISLILSYFYPRTALWLFLIYIPFNGTVVYWVGDGNPILQIARDVLYFPALIRLAIDCKRKNDPIFISKTILPGLVILLTFTLLTLVVINGAQQFYIPCEAVPERWVIGPDGRSYLYPCREGMPLAAGLLGLKILLGYIPLIFTTYYLIENLRHLKFLMRLMVTLAIIACVLGMVQFWLLRSGICQGTRGLVGEELFRANLDAKCFVGGSLIYSPEVGMIRLPGTFVSPWHWGWFLVSNAIICFAASFSETSRLWRALGILALTLVFINAVICGQRLAFIAVPLVILLLLLITGQIANFKRFIPIALVLGVLLTAGILLVNPDFAGERLQSAIDRWNTSPPLLFIQQQIQYSTDRYYSFLGWGLGKATSSARVFWPIIFLETFFAKLIYEMGYVGFFAYLIFISSVVFATFRIFIKIRDPNLRTIAGSCWFLLVFVAYVPYWYPLDTDPVGVYYWVFAGVIFRLPAIEKQEREKLSAASDDPGDGERLLKKRERILQL